MIPEQKYFGTVHLSSIIPNPKRCQGCLDLLTKIHQREPLRGKVCVLPENASIKYREKTIRVCCPVCDKTFNHIFYEVVRLKGEE